tara:strand:- start:3855 stop:4487 length:633 start_codon:yes stop_codon:yes gene_type:complete
MSENNLLFDNKLINDKILHYAKRFHIVLSHPVYMEDSEDEPLLYSSMKSAYHYLQKSIKEYCDSRELEVDFPFKSYIELDRFLSKAKVREIFLDDGHYYIEKDVEIINHHPHENITHYLNKNTFYLVFHKELDECNQINYFYLFLSKESAVDYLVNKIFPIVKEDNTNYYFPSKQKIMSDFHNNWIDIEMMDEVNYFVIQGLKPLKSPSF